MISIFIKILVYDSEMGEDFVNRFFLRRKKYNNNNSNNNINNNNNNNNNNKCLYSS